MDYITLIKSPSGAASLIATSAATATTVANTRAHQPVNDEMAIALVKRQTE